MQLTQSQIQELRVAFSAWRAIEQIEGRPFPVKDAFPLLVERAARYGALDGARSAWSRASIELAREGAITLRQPPPQPVTVPRDFRLRVAAMSSSDVRIAYHRDPEFRKLWDAMSLEDDGGTVRQVADEDAPIELTALQYRSMDASVLARCLQAPGIAGQRWRAAVEKLIAEGSI